MLKRAAAVQACMDRFAGKPYAAGTRDCAKLAAHALHRMGRSCRLLTDARHTTETGALKYVRRKGFDDLVALMDATGLPRIAPAAALPGDVVGLESGDAFGCSLSVALGDGRVLGFRDGVCQPLEPHAFVAAWRV
jgi:uncharacterized protein (AIM24 family)